MTNNPVDENSKLDDFTIQGLLKVMAQLEGRIEEMESFTYRLNDNINYIHEQLQNILNLKVYK